jgi:Cu/Ag efflux protein CusF
MKRSLLAMFVAIVCLAVVAPRLLAHGNEVHVLGTVAKISDTQITVETRTKEVQTVKIVPATRFFKSGAASSLKDLREGDRVVVHAKRVGDSLEAQEVRFGPAKPPSPKP